MKLKIGVLIDPIATLKPEKDSTVAMIKSAMALGWECLFFTQKDVFCQQGQAYAMTFLLTVGDEQSSDWATVKPMGEWPLSEFDIILMRKDPPFDLEYIYTTYALELAEKAGVLVSNKPQGLRDANEKYMTLHFPACCPPTLVSADKSRLRHFWQAHQPVIFKPLAGMGGRSIFYVDETGQNLSVILEQLTANGQRSIMAQRYIPAIKTTGDKRILVVMGKPIPYALARMPAPGELRANLAAGGKGQVVALTERDRWLCEQVGPTLLAKGLHFVGLDVIGDFITEINVTSPTCLRQISAVSGIDIAKDYLQQLALMKSSRKNPTDAMLRKE